MQQNITRGSWMDISLYNGFSLAVRIVLFFASSNVQCVYLWYFVGNKIKISAKVIIMIVGLLFLLQHEIKYTDTNASQYKNNNIGGMHQYTWYRIYVTRRIQLLLSLSIQACLVQLHKDKSRAAHIFFGGECVQCQSMGACRELLACIFLGGRAAFIIAVRINRCIASIWNRAQTHNQ